MKSSRPLPLETSVRRVFAVGDVRSGSVKRVGSAIGEGAVVVAELHAILAIAPPREAEPFEHQDQTGQTTSVSNGRLR
jgi:thioredoxin reductase (NADPH)